MTFRISSLFYLITLVVFTNCSEEKKRSEDTYFGGTVKNKNSNYIVVKDADNKLVKKFELDKSGHFLHKFENFKPGIYTFYDSKEAQSFFIEKGDSLIFRLNTLDFDESLVYTGTGSKENNYLIDLFLETEIQEKLFFKYSQLNSVEFTKKIDSLKNLKLVKLRKFSKKNKTSKMFYDVAEGNIFYQNYYSKEFYPFARLDKNEIEVLNSLDNDFYDYRKNINYNDTLLQNYFPYKSFLRFHFNNLALERYYKHSKDKRYNKTDLHYNLERLDLINEKIQLESIKNNLSYYYMIRYLNQSKNVKDFDLVLNKFKEVNTNEANIKKASDIVNSYKRLQPGFEIPNVEIINKTNDTLSLRSLIKKPSVIYFWTVNNRYHLVDSHKKINNLKEKYPEVNFIAINTDHISNKEQMTVLKHNQLAYLNEFRFTKPDIAKHLLAIQPINNVYIVDKEAKIINPKANMFSINFEKQLVEILN